MTHTAQTLVVLLVLGAGFYSVIHTKVVDAVPPMIFGTIAAVDAAWPTDTTAEESILFVGDVLLARDVEDMMHRYGHAYPFSDIQNTLQTARYVVANFESAIPHTHQPTPDLNTQFSTDQLFVPTLSEVGITHVSLANNHSFDFGSPALTNTRTVLREAAVEPLGDPRYPTSTPALVSVADVVVALIAVNATRPIDPDAVARTVRQASVVSDVQIAYMHWGAEYSLQHNQAQSALAHQMIKAGADAIIGHHPHVVQDIAVIDGVPVFYSLGNFVFDQYFSEAVQHGLMVELVRSEETIDFVLHPVTAVGSRTKPRLMSEYERERFLSELADRSDQAVALAIKQGVISIPEPLVELQSGSASSSMVHNEN